MLIKKKTVLVLYNMFSTLSKLHNNNIFKSNDTNIKFVMPKICLETSCKNNYHLEPFQLLGNSPHFVPLNKIRRKCTVLPTVCN